MGPAENLVERWVPWKFVVMTWLSVAGIPEGYNDDDFRRAYQHHLQGQDPIYWSLLFLNLSSSFLWFLSFFATVVFEDSKSQRVFERQWFGRRWDAVKFSCALSELSLLDIGYSKLLDLSTTWSTAVIFLVPSHVPSGSQKRSSESDWVSGSEAIIIF